MVAVTVKTPYNTAMPFVRELEGWIPSEYDRQRVASYELYDDLFHNDPDTMKRMLRGEDEQPVFIPTAQRIINTLSRYVGRGWGYMVDPDSGTESEQEFAKITFGELFKRERLLAKFTFGKKEFLRRGDWLWYLSADPDKAQGKRISVTTVDPRTYFPIFHPTDPTKIIGQQLIEQIMLGEGDEAEIAVKVQRWLKWQHADHPSTGNPNAPIANDIRIFALEGFGDPEEEEVVETRLELAEMPGIFSLPIYHIKNNEESDNPFGRSDLAGLESIVQGINQGISDEQEALAMAGLGMYYTDSGAPIDENGEETDWVLGAKRVIEVGSGRKFERVQGLSSVEPQQTHISKLEESAYGSNGITNIALGAQGANIQESGVALALRMSPLFDVASEKDITINDVLTQMFYDLSTMWLPTYEGINIGAAMVLSTVSIADRLPFDRETRFKELMDLHKAGVVTIEYVIKTLEAKFDYEFDEDAAAEAIAEQERVAALVVPQDIFDTRAGAEVAE